MRHCRNERTERDLQLATGGSSGAKRSLGWLLHRARAALSRLHIAPASGDYRLLWLDAHLLRDIGIGVDAIHRDPPRCSWPH